MRFAWILLPAILTAQQYDIVFKHGRVIDPESKLNAVRDVGIKGGKIAAITSRPLKGKIEIQADGLVVAPGFIDLHSHGQTPENYRYKAMDGVTVALELERGVSPLQQWYAERDGKALIHYGASAGYVPVRMAVMKDTGKVVPQDAAMNRLASNAERRLIEQTLGRDLADGGLGLGIILGFTPSAGAEEILDLFFLASKWRRPVFLHPRDAGVFESLQEAIADTAISGASLQIEHINSVAAAKTREALGMIEGARARGLDISTEAYPYIAGASPIESAMLSPGWQARLKLDYSDLMWAANGERLTAETFDRYRKQGGRVIMFYNTEEMVRAAIAHPLVMIGSDGNFDRGSGHPRSAGTFARILGRYVRDGHYISLMEAIRKCSLQPAQRLENRSPMMRTKGRLRVGADADVTVFDPERVIDKATFEKPAQYSEGFRYVLVNGTFVVREGTLQDGVAPGLPIRAR